MQLSLKLRGVAPQLRRFAETVHVAKLSKKMHGKFHGKYRILRYAGRYTVLRAVE